MSVGASGSHPVLDSTLAVLRDKILPDLQSALPPEKVGELSRTDIMREVKVIALDRLAKQGMELNLLDQRDLVTALTNALWKSPRSKMPRRKRQRKRPPPARGEAPPEPAPSLPHLYSATSKSAPPAARAWIRRKCAYNPRPRTHRHVGGRACSAKTSRAISKASWAIC